jgi:ABC-type Zn uptake system ZnuABC Zn-binding protein ZnuA
MSIKRMVAIVFLVAVSVLSACQPAAPPAAAPPGVPKVLAVESFLADIAQNVAGDRVKVETLMPLGIDPHAFEPAPQDVARIADSNVLIVNGAGIEAWLAKVLDNAGGQRRVIEAAANLTSRTAGEGGEAVDPHFWLDPTKVVAYVAAIRDGLTQADPGGEEIYAQNAKVYVGKLNELDAWIAGQIQQIPPARRLLVTNHESFGYFADRYGLRMIGAVVPSVSTDSAPSAQQLARLADSIRSTGAPAIFLETGANLQLAEQLRQETGVKVVTDLYNESITPADGPAPTYLDMMRYNTKTIVDALK